MHLGHAVSTLHDLGILDALSEPTTADELATKHEIDVAFLRGTLDYVALRTNLVRKTGKRFTATKHYDKSCRFLFHLYAGAFGENAVQLQHLMRAPWEAPQLVDRVMHAQAFEESGTPGLGWLAQIVLQLELNHVLDIGCGPASFLLQLAEQDEQFVGWGLESNPAMCRQARSSIRSAGLGKRVKMIQADAACFSKAIPARARDRIQTVTASHVVNEWFGSGSARVVEWLQALRTTLPGRTLLVADYYGTLGGGSKVEHRETLLHDYAQLISGQGIPPHHSTQWKQIYRSAGCRLVHIIDDQRTTRFLHIVHL